VIRPSGNAVNLQLLVSIASSHLRKNGQHCHVQKKVRNVRVRASGPGRCCNVRPLGALQFDVALSQRTESFSTAMLEAWSNVNKPFHASNYV
jgi:hypothetical protein